MARRVFTIVFVAAMLLGALRPGAHAAGISENLLPDTTKAYFCIPDYQLARQQWNATQLGQLLNDPAMQPFVKDLVRQLEGRRADDAIQLGVELDELEGIADGEVALATLQPGGEKGAHAQVLLAQVTGRVEPARQLLRRIGQNLVNQGAAHTTQKVGNLEIHAYRLPRRGRLDVETAYHFQHDDLLVTTDHEPTARLLAQRLQGSLGGKSLADLPAYQATMKRTLVALENTRPHARWFVEPFGCMEVMRAVRGQDQRRGTDLIKVLRNQGFDAIQGFGGHVALKTEDHEMLHRTFVYAPGKGGDERFELAARMLHFPNTSLPDPQEWVPGSVASYISWNWKMKSAFEYSKTMVNELAGAKAGEDLFEDIIGSIRDDVAGPRVDLRKELVQHLADRATLFTDFREPITPQSERLLMAIQLTDSEKVAETIRKIMEADPDAQRREVAGHVVWEIVSEEPAEVEEIRIVGAGFGPFEEPEPFEEEEEPLLPNMAVTVAHGNLMVASHLDFITHVLTESDGQQPLLSAPDYLRTRAALEKLGADQAAFSFFSRTDKAYRPTYELIRQGKMPESESMLGKLLNRMLGPDDPDAIRRQEIDGSKMPPFEQVRNYLGPAGIFITSQDDGWMVTGCLQHTGFADPAAAGK